MWQDWNGEHSAASSHAPAVVVLMSVLTPGQLGVTFRCISLVHRPCDTGWILKLASVQKGLSIPRHVRPIWLNGNINANWSRLPEAHKTFPYTLTALVNTCAPLMYRVCWRVKIENCSVGILPNIMGVRGCTCTHCTSTGLLVLWVGANRKYIDEWRCSILWCAVAVQHPLKCFSRLFCCKTSTERAWNDPISKRHAKVLLMLFDRSPTWGGKKQQQKLPVN